MRRKSENEERDRFARKFASVLLVEALIEFHANTGNSVLTVEAEDSPDWDDIVKKTEGQQHRYQVKRQTTNLKANELQTYVEAIDLAKSNVAYHFVIPNFLVVDDVGELRILHRLCRRIQQQGANFSKVISSLRDSEKKWINTIKTWIKNDEFATCKLLSRFHIHTVGFEDELDNRSLRLLEPIFRTKTEEAWAKIRLYVSDKDGVADIRPEDLWKLLPKPLADKFETFYWSLIEELEESLMISSWEGITDHLIRDLLNEQFHDQAQSFCFEIFGVAWPGNRKLLEKAILKVAECVNELLVHFTKEADQPKRGGIGKTNRISLFLG